MAYILHSLEIQLFPMLLPHYAYDGLSPLTHQSSRIDEARKRAFFPFSEHNLEIAHIISSHILLARCVLSNTIAPGHMWLLRM